MRKSLTNHEKVMRKSKESHEKVRRKSGESHEKVMRKFCESLYCIYVAASWHYFKVLIGRGGKGHRDTDRMEQICDPVCCNVVILGWVSFHSGFYQTN